MSINANTVARNSAWAKAYHEQKRHEWADRIEDMNRAGLNKSAYARLHGFSKGTVYRWTRILAEEPAGDLVINRGLKTAEKVQLGTGKKVNNTEVDNLISVLRKHISCTVGKRDYTFTHKRTHATICLSKDTNDQRIAEALSYLLSLSE